MRLELDQISVEIDKQVIVSNASVCVESGEVVGLIGPNGSGKSTLLRTIYRVLKPAGGTVRLGGDHAWSLPAREVARRCAVVSQHGSSDFDLNVHEVVLMGRSPHKRALDNDSKDDHRLVDEAVARVRMSHKSHSNFSTLSGGERQRVLVARAIAQQTPVLLLDEPTNHLDVRATLELLTLVRSLELTTLCVLHDLNHAAAYCDRLYVLCNGRIVADGKPDEVLTPSLLLDVFGVEAHRVVNPATSKVQLLFSRPQSSSVRSAGDMR